MAAAHILPYIYNILESIVLGAGRLGQNDRQDGGNAGHRTTIIATGHAEVRGEAVCDFVGGGGDGQLRAGAVWG